MKTLLLVEDEKDLRILYQQNLADEGYQIIAAENGQQAVEKLVQEKIDLAILDMQIDSMNGIETLNKIMEIDRNIKVILNSTYSNYRFDFATWAADAYLIKSSNLDELKSTVRELLK